MTCVVGYKSKHGIVFGADMSGFNGTDVRLRRDSKIFRIKGNGEGLLGFCGSFRIGQVLRQHLRISDAFDDSKVNGESIDDWMEGTFSERVRHLLKEYDAFEDKDVSEMELIVSFCGELFVIESDFQVMRPALNYAAIGSGSLAALGALYALSCYPPIDSADSKSMPALAVSAALEASSMFMPGISKETHLLWAEKGPAA